MDFSMFLFYNIPEPRHLTRRGMKGRSTMNRTLAMLLAALLMLCLTAVAEEDADMIFGDMDYSDADFGFEFVDDGYSGEWVVVPGLGFEFCLPDGWITADAPEDAAFFAANADNSAGLTIRVEAEDVDDVKAWGETHLERYELDEANFYDVLIQEDAYTVAVRTVIEDGRLVAFTFDRAGAEALPREFALQIVGSACVTWEDADIVAFDAEEGEMDFGEAFAEDAD